jgi:hypothetical protein
MGGAVSSVVDVVSDVVGGAVDVVSDVGSFIDDNVIQPALDDPIGTAAKVAAVATGNPQLLPVISGGQALASGADLGDVAKAAGTSYVAGQVGGDVGGAVASETGSQLAGNIAAGAAAGGTGAAISGGDVGTGLLTGGINAGIAQGVNAAVDTGSNLLSGTTPSTGTTGMDDTLASFIEQDAQNLAQQGYSADTIANIMQQNYGVDQYAAANIGSIATTGMPGDITSVLTQDYGADLTGLAQSAGVDNNTLTSLLKQFGTAAVKSLLGSKTGTTTGAQQGAAGTTGGLLGAGANYFLSQNQLGKLQDAYAQNVAQQQAATQQAQQAATFKPVGMTTAFGTSQFQVDPTTGQLVSAGYTASPELAAQRERLFGLGAAALPTTADTQAVQQQYIAQQQGLLAPGREQQLAQLRNRQYQRGTTGLATGGTVAGYAPNAAGLMATNPEMAAYYNSLAQQNAQLAANAPTYAQNLLNQQIATGTGLFGAANTLEGYAQQPLTTAANLGTLSSTAGAKAGQLGLLGGQAASQTALQGQLAGIYGQGQALSSAVNPLVTAAQQGLSTAIGNWLS